MATSSPSVQKSASCLQLNQRNHQLNQERHQLNQRNHQLDSSRQSKDVVVSSVLREMSRMSVDESVDESCEVIDKINFQDVKEIKSESFNKRDFFALLRDGKERLRSFQVGAWSHDVDPVELAECGFYYLQNGDRVQCVFCEIVLDGWNRADDPLREHLRHSPRCNFIAGYDVKNIPIRSDPVRGPGRRLPATDVCGTNRINSPSDDEVMSELSDEETENSGSPLSSSQGSSSSRGSSSSQGSSSFWSSSITRRGPVHKSFVSFGARVKSFENGRWPRECPVSTSTLAAAGFFYFGPFMGFKDSVKCFYCDTGLCQWDPDDDPWKEHKRVSPHCEFLQLNYPSSNLKRFNNTQQLVDDWISSDLVQQFLSTTQCSRNIVKNVLSQRWLNHGYPFQSMEELKEAVSSYDPLSNLIRRNHESPSHELTNGGEVREPSNSNWSQSSSQVSVSQGSVSEAPSSQVSSSEAPSSQMSSSEAPSSQMSSSEVSVSGYESGSQCNSYHSGSECEEGSLRGRLTCKVCWDNDIGCIILPCKHIATCTQCAPALTTCPICREIISSVEKVFF